MTKAEWYQANKESCKKQAKAWRLANPERSNQLKRDWAARNPDKIKGNWKRYGITLTREAYEQLLEAQNGLCAICHKPPGKKNLAVDHDHETGEVRGLLHTACNIGLGCLKTPENCRAAAEYLEI